MKIYKAMILAAMVMAVASLRAQTYVTAEAVNPRTPMSVTFAGKTISLTNLDMRERYDREITAMTYTHGNTLLQIKRANRYFPMLMPILQKNGVPADLIYLACIESTLNTRAVSAAKAAGLWQFIPETAKEYGLEVNDYVDERYDPVRSTEAACRFLKAAYAKYGNWESVAASYNTGQARVTRELAYQGTSSAYNLWLSDETMRYIFRLLAAKAIMETPAAYGFVLEADQLYQPYEYREVTVSTPVADWAAWAVDNGTTYYLLREHNQWIRNKSLPNKSGKAYIVRIPTEKSLNFDPHNLKTYNPAWIGQ